MSYKNNKFLIVQATVVMTPIIEPVIIALDTYFEKANKKALVTSGLRNADDQLRVIRGYMVKKGLDGKYPEAMKCEVKDMKGVEYVWQMGWSELLHLGVIINPPLAARCLLDTTFDKRNRRGLLINQTPHAKGTAFNIGGGGDGVEDEAAVIQKALDDKLPGLASFLKERENNAVHCNCIKI